MILGARSSWGHVCQNFFYYLKGFSVSLLKCQSSSDKALDIVFNVMYILTSAAHIFLWNQNLCILLGCTIWLGLIDFSLCPQTKSLIFPLKPASSYLIATENYWGQKSWRHPICLLLFPSHLPGPPAGSASDRHSEPNALSSPWQPHWSKLLSPSMCKLWSLPVPLCFCPCPSRLLGRARGTPRSACALLCQSVCWLWGRKSWGCLLFLSLLTSLLYVSCAAPCPLPTGLQPLRSAAPQASRPAPCPLGTCLPALLPSDICSDIILAQRLSLLPSIRYSNTPPTPPKHLVSFTFFFLQPLSSVTCRQVNTYLVFLLSRSVVPNSLRPHGPQHAGLPVHH